jgi:hypothetical protein
MSAMSQQIRANATRKDEIDGGKSDLGSSGTTITRFEDEYPQAAKFLMELYHDMPTYTDSRGNAHWLPYRIHVLDGGPAYRFDYFIPCTEAKEKFAKDIRLPILSAS